MVEKIFIENVGTERSISGLATDGKCDIHPAEGKTMFASFTFLSQGSFRDVAGVLGLHYLG